jgi:hypothetical protein
LDEGLVRGRQRRGVVGSSLELLTEESLIPLWANTLAVELCRVELVLLGEEAFKGKTDVGIGFGRYQLLAHSVDHLRPGREASTIHRGRP